MATVKLLIDIQQGLTIADSRGQFFADVIYTRAISSGDKATDGSNTTATTSNIQETVRATLDGKLNGSLDLDDVVETTPIDINFLAGNGAVRIHKQVSVGQDHTIAVILTKDDVATILAPDPQPAPTPLQITRSAFFIPVGDIPVPFENSKLQIVPINVRDAGWTDLGMDKIFHNYQPITSSVVWNGMLPKELAGFAWSSLHLAIDGKFSFSFNQGAGDSWIWWLSGPLSAIGIVLDELSKPKATAIGVALPPFPSLPSNDGGGSSGVPKDVTETEVVSNPDIYTEDPGEFCRPFKNPERVLGERSFFVIIRAEQPSISAEASLRKDTFNVVTSTASIDPRSDASRMLSSSSATRTNTGVTTNAGSFLADAGGAAIVRSVPPATYEDILKGFNRGRTIMNAANPVQWEGDISRYQATTVARGHILEYRMRWRSNGYSLGTVAKSLTLAPRQTRRIQKIEWRRSELSRRQETTQLTDTVSDTSSRERDYDDSVQANLSEWARGQSESSMSAGAVGFGFAGTGFVLGGGGASSNAESESSQEGGRRTTAAEEQRLQDSIRRYGDSLRKLDSMVVTEVTQEEEATGTTEVVRNANYGHSLTVIYHQILRHLQVETAVVGVRECLFVPFAITPFTVARAYRWREYIQKTLRDSKYVSAMANLKDVLTNFAYSDIPAGRRSDQPIRYLFGSIFITLAIERPKDKEDGSFDVNAWLTVSQFLGSPALSIFSRLKALAEEERDTYFQEHDAPTIAANWVDTLKLSVGTTPLSADFTLATRYQFNNVVRVDFNAAISSGISTITREDLSSIQIRAMKDLAPGSVANVQNVSFTYQTDNFQRSFTASGGTGDLVTVESGSHETNGDTVGSIPDTWERRDIRSEMIYAVQELIEHLNEHVEYYHKAIWWNMDRDRLFMLIDGFYAPGTNNISIASVVERDPIGIIGNAVVYRVASGSFLGIGSIKTPKDLLNYYISSNLQSEPMLISLPTDGLYAQSVMDECSALEEHFGNTDWALSDPDPDLGQIAPELLATRRTEPVPTTPTSFPQTLINLQNTPEAPAPSGLAGALSAVTNPNSFRDMAGLAGTQANAATAFQTAANLASSFGAQAAALKLAETAKEAHDAQTADKKLATVQSAVNKGLVTPGEGQKHTSMILDSLHAPSTTSRPHEDPTVSSAIAAAAGKPGSSIQAITPEGQVSVSLDKPQPSAPPGTDQTDTSTTTTTTTDTESDDSKQSFDVFGWTDSHGEDVARTSWLSTDSQLNPQIAFGSGEHSGLGTEGLQPMIDAWARAGLISGGAFVQDTDSNGELRALEEWQIFTPDYTNPKDPYGDFPVGSRAHWHWIIPNALMDENGNRWTVSSLKSALLTGMAATLSMGDIVALSGDLIEKFEDFKNAGKERDLWRKGPVNAMKGYEDLEPYAMTCLRIKLYPSKGTLGKLDELKMLQRNLKDYSGIQQEIAHGIEAWERVKGDVEYLKELAGKTGCSEILVLSRITRKESEDIRTLLKITPWSRSIAGNYMNRVIDFDILQGVLTNGYYYDLALRNQFHFAPDNWNRFEQYQEAALKMIENLALNPGPTIEVAPIPADAVALVAYGMHFMTDAFASGHMRVPRALLGSSGAFLSKVMHDIDGEIGLYVRNDFGQEWRAFGDGSLNTRSDFQKKLIEKLGASNASPADNLGRILSAMASAMKQLHYQAQKYIDEPSAQNFHDVLQAARGSSTALSFDDWAPDGTPGDPGAGRDEWIATDIAAKISFLLKHKPIPLPSGGQWLTNSNFNLPELVLPDGTINNSGDYYWTKAIDSLGEDRIMRVYKLDDPVRDITELYQLVVNFPGGATWYGTPEKGLLNMLNSLPHENQGLPPD